MRRKRLLCSRGYQPKSSWPIRPMTPIICAKPSLPKARSPSSPITRHARSNIRSTSISMPSAISSNAASQSSSNSGVSQPASKRQPEITLPSSLLLPSSYGCDKCPHDLALQFHFSLEVRSLCFGLVSASPERPCDDASGLDAAVRELEGDTTDFLDRPADQERRLIDRRGNVFLGPTAAALAR